jgi:hypothetical protein
MNTAANPHNGAGHENPHGVDVHHDGTVRFRLWAPACSRIELELLGEARLVPMTATEGG